MAKVKVSHRGESATSTDEHPGVAAIRALRMAGTCTLQGNLVAIIATALSEWEKEVYSADLLHAWLHHTEIPGNAAEIAADYCMTRQDMN